MNRQLSRRGLLIGGLGALRAQTAFRESIAGSVILPNDAEYDLARFYSGFMSDAPPELAVELTIILNDPPTIVAMVCWSGTLEGTRVLRALRAFGPPEKDLVDTVGYLHLMDRFPELGSLLGPRPPRDRQRPPSIYWRGGSLRALSNTAADQFVAIAQVAPPGSSIGMGHFMHGQVCRVAQDATPLPRIVGQFMYFINASWYEPDNAEASMAWVDRSWTTMKRYSRKGAYINYLSSDEPAAVKASYGANYARLAQLKRKYDPTNFFHHNRNIRASALRG